LPQIEEEPLRNVLATGKTSTKRTLQQVIIDANSNGGLSSPEVAALQTSIALFRCASDVTPATIPGDLAAGDRPFDPNPAAPSGFQPATSNYVGNAGFFYARQCLPNKKFCDGSGVFGYGVERISMKKIVDGTSKTLLIGERSEYGKAASWNGNPKPRDINYRRAGYVVGWTTFGINEPAPDPAVGIFRGAQVSFGSAHPGGANFALADGSTRFITEEINYEEDGCRHGIPDFNPTDAQPWPAEWPTCTNNRLGLFHRLGSRNEDLTIPDSF
jgi:prepilin-type processing-associated H-X9-DG protein